MTTPNILLLSVGGRWSTLFEKPEASIAPLLSGIQPQARNMLWKAFLKPGAAMERLPREIWIQSFCLLLATADRNAYGGALLRVATECWEHSRNADPIFAVRQLLLSAGGDAGSSHPRTSSSDIASPARSTD